VKFLRFLILVFCFGCVMSQFLYAGSFHVEKNGHISEVIESAAPGDTIIIESGEYSENLVIDIPLIIIGKDYPHIRGGYKGHVILVTASNTIVSGLKISEAGTRLIDDFACVQIEADSVLIIDNIISRPLHGVYVKGGNNIEISGNRIEGRLDLISPDRGNGIHLWNSQGNKIINNQIWNVRDGIYFSFANKTLVEGNHIHHVRYGLHYMYSDENVFTNNLFENNVAGAALMYSQHILFEKNVFAKCRGFRAYGILYQSMNHTSAVNNLIIDNSRGIFFDNCNDNSFTDNDVVDNDLALQLMGNGERNKIIHNNFINNLGNLVLDGKRTDTEWTGDEGGNYWSDYQGYDLDGDGLGDVPHILQNVFQVLEAETPEIRFYLNSPAAEILALAEEALPILELGLVKDLIPVFKPLDNKAIPWERTDQLNLAASPIMAIAFLLCGIIPFTLLLYLSRKHRK